MRNWRRLEVIGFDLDNTLYPVTPEVDAVIQSYIHEQSAEILGISFDEAKHRFDALYQAGQGLSGGKTLKAMGIQTDRDIVQEALEHADVASTLKPDYELVELIGKLSSNYASIDLITGSNRRQTYAKIAALGLSASDFDLVLTADDASKSTGEAYQLWLDHHPDVSPDAFLYVGDRKQLDSDIPATFGIQTALVNSTATPTPETPVFRDLTTLGQTLLDTSD